MPCCRSGARLSCSGHQKLFHFAPPLANAVDDNAIVDSATEIAAAIGNVAFNMVSSSLLCELINTQS